MNVIERYEQARRAAITGGPNVPTEYLRDYLDVIRYIKKWSPGLVTRVITVGKNPATGILNWDIMVAENIPIRVTGWHETAGI